MKQTRGRKWETSEIPEAV